MHCQLTRDRSVAHVLWTAGWAVFFLAGCANSDSDVSGVQADEAQPGQTVINGTFRYSERGVILHELQAAEMRREEHGNAEVSEEETLWSTRPTCVPSGQPLTRKTCG